MAYVLVQANSTDANTGASPLTVNYTNTPVQGNLLLAEVTNDTSSAALTSLKDGNGNSFTLLNSLNRSTAQWTAQYAMIATASQSKAITATLAASTLYLTLYEFSGNFATIGSIIDNAQANSSTFAAGVNNSTSQPSVTPTNAGDLIWTTIGFSGTTTAQTVTDTFTTLTKNTSAATKLYGAYRIPGSTSARNPSWAWTTSRTGVALTTALLPAVANTPISPWVPSNNQTGPQALRNSFRSQITPWFVDGSVAVVNASVTQVAATVTASGGTQTVAAQISTSVAQVTATVTATGGTQSTNINVTQVAATVTASGGTQVIATINIVAIAQSAATVTASGGTQAIATVNDVAISQLAGTVTASGGTQAIDTVNIVSISQVAGTVTASSGTQVIDTVNIVTVTQVAGVVTASGGTQVVSTAAGSTNASVAQSAATVTATGGVQIISTSTGPISARKYYLDTNGEIYWVISQKAGLVERV